ncbi:spore germination protein [Metabacillus sp. RGM 3146]|uniref:spore germination protein n=1 Tax=Metabacillus sp. RGM 3146 TaxID=3401092 RepID=UPI003B9ADB66
MPAIVGPIKINSVHTGAVVNFGDTFYISPKTTTKTASGSGGANVGDFWVLNNGISATNQIDQDLSDQNIGGNS